MTTGSLVGSVVLLLVCVLPSAIYVGVQTARGRTGREVLAAVGARWGRPGDYAWALVILVVGLGLTVLTIPLIRTGLGAQGVVTGDPSSVVGWTSTGIQTLAEEVLFRGLIAGILIRRLGLAVGNVLQALVFLIPHLLLIVADIRLWPILVLQFVAALVLGWLRQRSGSFLPGWVAHALINLLSPVLAAAVLTA